MKLTPKEALARLADGKKVYMATWDGEVWGAGQMNEVGDLIGYFATQKDARAACRECRESPDFDKKRCRTSFEEVDETYIV